MFLFFITGPGGEESPTQNHTTSKQANSFYVFWCIISLQNTMSWICQNWIPHQNDIIRMCQIYQFYEKYYALWATYEGVKGFITFKNVISADPNAQEEFKTHWLETRKKSGQTYVKRLDIYPEISSHIMPPSKLSVWIKDSITYAVRHHW